MAVKLLPLAILALFMVAIFVIVGFLFYSQTLFGGPEYDAQSTVAELLNEACSENPGFKTTLSIFMPDSKGVRPPNIDFFFLSATQDHLLLGARRWGVEKNDLIAQFQDFTSCVCSAAVQFAISDKLGCGCKPGIRILRDVELKTCKRSGVEICPSDPQQECNNFAFESNEGSEALSITVERTTENTVVLSYNRAYVCGDFRCCPGEENPDSELYCKPDCNVPEPKCQITTVD